MRPNEYVGRVRHGMVSMRYTLRYLLDRFEDRLLCDVNARSGMVEIFAVRPSATHVQLSQSCCQRRHGWSIDLA